MQRPPLMFAAIVIVVFLVLLGIIGLWFGVLPFAQAGGYPARP
jgi:spore maturation protein SpmA